MKKRILYMLQEYPQLSETYIYNEIEHVSHLYELQIFAISTANTPYRNHRAYCVAGEEPKKILHEIVEGYHPDVVHVHYVTTALKIFPFCEHYGIPFTIRAHSFDALRGFDPGDPSYTDYLAKYADIVNSDLCLGLLTFPFTCEYFIRAGVREEKLYPSFPIVDVQRFFDTSDNGDAVINMGAGLPKKAMGDFLKLANMLPQLTFNLFAIGYHADQLREENKAIEGLCRIHDPVQPEDMPAVYKQHRWLVYTASRTSKTVGWPLAVAEAQASGVGVCMANIRPDLADYLGEGGGILFDDLEELKTILPGPVPPDMRERGFELCRRSDVRRNIQQLTDLWDRA